MCNQLSDPALLSRQTQITSGSDVSALHVVAVMCTQPGCLGNLRNSRQQCKAARLLGQFKECKAAQFKQCKAARLLGQFIPLILKLIDESPLLHIEILMQSNPSQHHATTGLHPVLVQAGKMIAEDATGGCIYRNRVRLPTAALALPA